MTMVYYPDIGAWKKCFPGLKFGRYQTNGGISGKEFTKGFGSFNNLRGKDKR